MGAFYEGQELDAKNKQPLAIALANHDPYVFAGPWDRWTNPSTGESLETFCVITPGANQVVAPKHKSNAVILDHKDYERWLRAGDPSATPLTRSALSPTDRSLP